MTLWADRILKEFPADLARLWIVADFCNCEHRIL